MRLYASKIPAIVDGIVRALVHSGDLEVGNLDEFKADVESILKEYLRSTRELTERAKDQLESRGLNYSELHKVKRQLAEDQSLGIGDDAVKWITNQLLELFMQSSFVEEIYAEDPVLRRKIQEVLRHNMLVDEDLDREVRSHLKHLSEGTTSFEIEYQRQLDLVKRKHGLT
jgi:hypothetical protein